MLRVAFLSRMSLADVEQAFAGYVQSKYGGDWQGWLQTCASCGIGSVQAAAALGKILRRWQAVRPYPLRRIRCEAAHEPPYLEDVLEQALVWVRALDDVSLRNIDCLSPGQAHALEALWRVLLGLPYRGRASCVGITKAAMFLTEGRLGPSLDSKVRDNLNLARPESARVWLQQLRSVHADLGAFEDKHQVALEDLAPSGLGPLAVGRAYDVIAWSG